MKDSKVISVRVSESKYEKILLECEAKGITVSEYLERKMALAGSIKELKKDIAEKVESAYRFIDLTPRFAKNKLMRILKGLNEF